MRRHHAGMHVLTGLILVLSTLAAVASLLAMGETRWMPVGSMSIGREAHTATRLAGGRVLVAGGFAAKGGTPLASAEIYDGGTWSSVADMASGRYYHLAAPLADGRVLVAGGFGGGDDSLASAEIYDASKDTWAPASDMRHGRGGLAGTALLDGRVFVAGGQSPGEFGAPQSSAEVYDPDTNSWTATRPMKMARSFATATLLGDGRVLVTGGGASGGKVGDESWLAEIYDPFSDTWISTGNMLVARSSHTATLLADGRVLVAGGLGAGIFASIEIYDPASNAWAKAAAMGIPRVRHTASLLQDGWVLVTGGVTSDASKVVDAEFYDPLSNTWHPAPSMNFARAAHTATTVPGGRVLVAGGRGALGTAATAELYGANTPPTANAGPDQTVPGCATCLATVTLNGFGSFDPDGDTLTYTWKKGATTLATNEDPVAQATVALGVGTHVITLTVSDGAGGTGSDEVVVTVVDAVSALEAELETLRVIAEASAEVVSAALNRIEQDFREVFRDPAFQIPGATSQERLDNLVGALVRLNAGRKMGIYADLRGRR